MNALDAIAPAFRRARDRWPGAATLVSHYEDLAATYSGNQHSLIELIKSFIEAVCITILLDHGKEVEGSEKTTGLLTRALEELGLRNSRGANRFDKVLSAHNQLAEALTHVRNKEAPVAHGKDGYLDALTENHIRVYLLSADAILSLILGALDGVEPNLKHTREPYERFEHLHNRIDRLVQCYAEWDEETGLLVLRFGTEALESLRFRTSEILFHLDRDAYVAVLSVVGTTGIQPMTNPDPNLPPRPSEQHNGEFDEAPSEPVRHEPQWSSSSVPLQEYVARLVPPELLDKGQAAALASKLLAGFEPLAVVDWKSRENAKARIRVVFKHILHDFKIEKADPISQELLAWFEVTQ